MGSLLSYHGTGPTCQLSVVARIQYFMLSERTCVIWFYIASNSCPLVLVEARKSYIATSSKCGDFTFIDMYDIIDGIPSHPWKRNPWNAVWLYSVFCKTI